MEKDNSISWIKQLTGPAGALVICVFGIYFLGKFIDKMAARHFEAIDQMTEENKIARKAQTENMIILSENVKELSVQTEKLKTCCNK